ncbi:hypothetical protein [Niabella hibiscisoli]|uniref:hypothetical protein n=1 Tax=Niabella hibiscisoli TaxID=1825928 RepID=UPI001F10DC4C|nr:hypothetical protein [Niabella hibiscisoli]MCH5719110.1 hypothetical protein [Niabella hibiscisoli]
MASAVEHKKKSELQDKSKLQQVEQNIERLESRYFNNEIESETYKKWYKKYRLEKSLLLEQLTATSLPGKAQQLKLVSHHIDKLTSLNELYESVTVDKKQMLNNGFYFPDGRCRTTSFNKILDHNI